MRCRILTASKTLFDDEADSLTVPAVNGEMEVLPGHAEAFAALATGAAVVLKGGKTWSFPIESGALHVHEDAVDVLL